MHPMLPLLALLTSLTTAPAPTTTAADDGTSKTTVRLLDIADHDVLPGTVRPNREVTLGSPFDTLLGSIGVTEGQTVRKGDVVAVLDDRTVRAALQLAETEAARTAQIDRAQAVLDQAQDTLARLERAKASNATANSELTDARSAVAIAKADLSYAREQHDEAQKSLALAKSRVEEHIIRAPFDAIVVRKLAEPGAMLSAGAPIAQLISLDTPCVDLYLPASLASTLAPGTRYAIELQDPAPHVTPATVRYVEPRIDPISRTMRVVFDFDPTTTPIVTGALAIPATTPPTHTEANADSD